MACRAFILGAACLVGAVGVATGEPPVAGGGAEASFQEYCRLCHRVPADLGRQRSYERWREIVARMSAHRQQLKRGEIPVTDQLLIARYLGDGR